MSSLEIACIAFACVFGAAMLGMFMRGLLPEAHVSQESKDVVKLGTGLVATMAALVLSLLVSSAKSSFDRMNDGFVENAAKAIVLDRTLADYGPETKELRDQMKRAYAVRVENLFSGDDSRISTVDNPDDVVRTESIQSKLWELTPHSDAQRALQSRAVEIAGEMSATRWLLVLQRDNAVPVTLLCVLVSWLSIIFAAFGLFAPRNATVIAALFVCALSASGAIFLILEMDSPLDGLMRISSIPMRDALAHLGR